MIQIPDNFPSYTAYNAKQLLQQVDTLKAAIKELQENMSKMLLNEATLMEQVHALQQKLDVDAPKASKAK